MEELRLDEGLEHGGGELEVAWQRGWCKEVKTVKLRSLKTG